MRKFDLGFWHNREIITVKVDGAALVFSVREHLDHGLQHPHALVADDALHAVQAAPAEPLEEADPAVQSSWTWFAVSFRMFVW